MGTVKKKEEEGLYSIVGIISLEPQPSVNFPALQIRLWFVFFMIQQGTCKWPTTAAQLTSEFRRLLNKIRFK